MPKATPTTKSAQIGKLLWWLLLLQIIFTLLITGRHIVTNNTLQLFFNQDYFLNEKVEAVRGQSYSMSLKLAKLPLVGRYQLICPKVEWFINYYMFPRQFYFFDGVRSEADIAKKTLKWYKKNKIDYVLYYVSPQIRFEDVRKKSLGGQ